MDLEPELKRALGLEPELKLNFVPASRLSKSDFEQALYALFFRPDEDQAEYIRKNDLKLVERYIDVHEELFLLPTERRLAILGTIRTIGLTATPTLERVGNEIYVPAKVIDGSIYNDLRVDKNQRIASSIEAVIPDIRGRIALAVKELPAAISGVSFRWSVVHGDSLRNSYATEQMELLTPTMHLVDFLKGNLSAFELVQKSTLRENGIKITLTSWDPIGAR